MPILLAKRRAKKAKPAFGSVWLNVSRLVPVVGLVAAAAEAAGVDSNRHRTRLTFPVWTGDGDRFLRLLFPPGPPLPAAATGLGLLGAAAGGGGGTAVRNGVVLFCLVGGGGVGVYIL